MRTENLTCLKRPRQPSLFSKQQRSSQMNYLSTNCRLMSLQEKQVQAGLSVFSCGDKDLDEFFHSDAAAYEHALFGKGSVRLFHTFGRSIAKKSDFVSPSEIVFSLQNCRISTILVGWLAAASSQLYGITQQSRRPFFAAFSQSL